MYGVFYMLLGYFLEHRLADFEPTRKKLFALWFASFGIIAVSILVTRHVTGSLRPGELAYGCLLLPSATLFLTVKSIHISSLRISKPLQTFSGAVLFVMLMENLFRIMLGSCEGILAQYMPCSVVHRIRGEALFVLHIIGKWKIPSIYSPWGSSP